MKASASGRSDLYEGFEYADTLLQQAAALVRRGNGFDGNVAAHAVQGLHDGNPGTRGGVVLRVHRAVRISQRGPFRHHRPEEDLPYVHRPVDRRVFHNPFQ